MDSEEDLPPSVYEDDNGPELQSDDSLMSLPPSVHEEEPAVTCCKRGLCSTKFEKDALAEYKMNFARLAQGDRLEKVFEVVRNVARQSKEQSATCFQWTILGQTVCRKFWEATHGVGHGALDNMVRLAKSGHSQLPLRPPRLGRATPASNTLDAWFLTLYKDLAEPLAVPGSGDSVVVEDTPNFPMQCEELADINHPLFLDTINSDRPSHQVRSLKVPKRYLNFDSVASLFQFYKQDEALDLQVSHSTFKKGWQSWRSFLPLKNAGSQSKCIICASLSERRTGAADSAERAAIDKEKKDHINVVMADRRIAERGNKRASKEAVFLKTENDDQVMKVVIDGMDQSKFCLPRVKRLVGTSALAKAWRPCMHISGGLIHGQMEWYGIMASDTPKDASMNCTILARLLDLTASQLSDLGDAYSFPGHLCVSIDNTPREGKNSFFASFLSYLVHRRIFKSVQCEFLQVDHTHNELDQRFSSLASFIKAADCLQDPEDLCQWMTDHMKASCGRTLKVESVANTWNFKDWMGQVGLHVEGLTSTHVQPYANHVWRFESRLFVTEQEIECHHPDWQGLEQHPEDVILRVKQFISSSEWSQKPQLLLSLVFWQ